MTGPCNGKEPLLKPYLATAATGGAGLGSRSRLGTFPLAGVTGNRTRNGNGLLGTKRRFLEGNIEAVTEILSAACATASAPWPTTTEDVAEEVTKNVLEVPTEVESA